MSNQSTVAIIVRRLETVGWRVERGAGHYKAFAPNGTSIVTVPTTPNGVGLRRTEKMIRRVERSMK